MSDGDLGGVGRTLVILKPDAVGRGLIGEIVGRLEAKGLSIGASEMRSLDPEAAGRHYAEHDGKAFYEGLITFITSGPVLVLIVEGPKETWKIVRTMMGATDPKDAAPGTIRGDLASVAGENLIHGSDSPEAAEREISIFFPHLA
jgi:nucleoside-diphosphate kinase